MAAAMGVAPGGGVPLPAFTYVVRPEAYCAASGRLGFAASSLLRLASKQFAQIGRHQPQPVPAPKHSLIWLARCGFSTRRKFEHLSLGDVKAEAKFVVEVPSFMPIPPLRLPIVVRCDRRCGRRRFRDVRNTVCGSIWPQPRVTVGIPWSDHPIGVESAVGDGAERIQAQTICACVRRRDAIFVFAELERFVIEPAVDDSFAAFALGANDLIGGIA